MFIHFFSLRSSRFLSFSRLRSNKREGPGNEVGEKAGERRSTPGETWGGGGDPYFSHSQVPVSFPSRRFLETPATQTIISFVCAL